MNIDNFAHAVKLTWETDDNVIAVLQGLGASTFLALLERSHLMDTINAQGKRRDGLNPLFRFHQYVSLDSLATSRAVDDLRAGQPSVAIAAQGRVRSHYARLGPPRPDTVVPHHTGKRHPARNDKRSEIDLAARRQSRPRQFLLGWLGECKLNVLHSIAKLFNQGFSTSGTRCPVAK